MKKLAALLLLWPGVAVAAEPVMDPLQATFKMLAGLAVVLGVMLLLFALAKRYMPLLGNRREGRIRVLESRGVGAKKSLVLVEVAGEELLLGVGVQDISLLARYPRGERQNFDQALRGEMEKTP